MSVSQSNGTNPSSDISALEAKSEKQLVVVITGSTSGLGFETARILLKSGHRVVISGRSSEKVSQAVQSLVSEGIDAARIGSFVADVQHREQVDQLARYALSTFGQINVWINNAGQGITRKVEDLTDEDFDSMMSINCKSVLYGMQAFMRYVRTTLTEDPATKKKVSSIPDLAIINVSGTLGRFPIASFRSAYAAAKAAVNTLTANLRIDVAQEQLPVRVVCYHPGVFATEFGIKALHGGPDSRKLPTVQPLAEVASILANLATGKDRRVDVYSREADKERIVRYFAAEDMASEEKLPTPASTKN